MLYIYSKFCSTFFGKWSKKIAFEKSTFEKSGAKRGFLSPRGEQNFVPFWKKGNKGPPETRTRINGFKDRCDNLYTSGPCKSCPIRFHGGCNWFCPSSFLLTHLWKRWSQNFVLFFKREYKM
jgi:hypothetical protein